MKTLGLSTAEEYACQQRGGLDRQSSVRKPLIYEPPASAHGLLAASSLLKPQLEEPLPWPLWQRFGESGSLWVGLVAYPPRGFLGKESSWQEIKLGKRDGSATGS